MTNKELVEKAVITTAALAAAGKLNPQQSDRFIDYVIDVTKLKDMARVVRFKPEELTIEKIGVGRRVAVPKAEATDPGVRRGVQTSKVTLHPVEIMVPFEIGDIFSEINIEGQSVEDTIIRMMATQLANDLEELYINGDLLGPASIEADLIEGGSPTQFIRDSYLALQDGWLRLADGANIVDANGVNADSALFSQMLNAMPDKFKRDRTQLRFLCSPDIEQNYRQKVSNRATAAGDVALSTTQNLTPFGVELVPVPMLQLKPRVVEHVTVNTDGVTPTPLRYAPVSDVVVTSAALGGNPENAFIQGTDYTVDEANGTITRLAGGTIPAGGTVKVTYKSSAQILLTNMRNFIIGIGRDIRIEKDRDIFKGVNQFAITAKVSVNYEELSAIVKATNVGLS